MNEGGRVPWLLGFAGLVALVAWGAATPRSQSPRAAPARTPPAAAAAPGAAVDPVKCTVEAFAEGSEPAPTQEGLIALVPHPMRSGLPAVFDAHVEALQRAVEDAGWVLDRYWLPWSRALVGEEAARQSGLSPCAGAARAGQPGILLFRETARREHGLLLVLLVPESPSSGVDKEVFSRALDLLAGLPGADPDAPSLRIVGPTFSGSAVSVQSGIRSWSRRYRARHAGARLALRLVSGSMTDLESGQSLDEMVDAEAGDALDVSFRTTIHSDQFVEDLFFHYLDGRHALFAPSACPATLPQTPARILDKVAFLVESNTTYGQALLQPRKGEKTKRVLRIPFPMHVGQIRAEWRRLTEDRAAREDGDLEPTALGLPEEEDSSRDVVPSYSLLTPVVEDLVLTSSLEEIARREIEYLGIVATDVRDRLFLARMARERYPDVTLFTLSSDLLYTHPRYARELEGMLVASTYPLFPENQRWAYPHRGYEKTISFPTGEAVGVFNATLVLLGREDLMLDYGLPHAQHHDPGARTVPPVWVSAVGRGHLWPVAALCVDGRGRESANADSLLAPGPLVVHEKESHSAPVTSSVFFKFYALTFALFLVLHGAGYLVARTDRRGFGTLRRSFAVFEASEDRDTAQRMYLLGMFYVLSTVYAWITVPLVLRFAVDLHTGDLGVLVELLVVVVGWVVLLSPPFHLTRGFLRAKPGEGGWWGTALALALLVPVTLVLGTLSYALSPLSDLVWRRPVELAWVVSFYRRASSLGSGLSPLLPMLFLGLVGYLWSRCALRRLHLREEARYHVAATRFSGSTSVLLKLKSQLDALLDENWSNMKNCLWVFVGVGLFLGVSLELMPPSVDGLFFVGLFELFYFLACVSIAFEFARFARVWTVLARMLRIFSTQGLADALRRLPESVTAVPLLDPFPAGVSLRTLEIAVGRLGAIARQSAGRAPGPEEAALQRALGPDRLEAERLLAAALEAEASEPRLISLSRRALLQRVDAAVGTVVETLPRARAVGCGWLAAAEELAAVAVLRQVRYVFAQLRNLLFYSVSATLLVLAAISCYPFPRKPALLALCWLAVLAIVGVTVAIFIQMDRNEVLSQLNRSEPGRVAPSWELAGRVAAYVLAPLLGLVSAQFPQVARFLFFWVQPLITAFR